MYNQIRVLFINLSKAVSTIEIIRRFSTFNFKKDKTKKKKSEDYPVYKIETPLRLRIAHLVGYIRFRVIVHQLSFIRNF